MIADTINQEAACFEINEHGRFTRANRKFCRMFGFDESEVMWHYITDLYRYPEEWLAYSHCDNMSEHNFVSRMRNRKGRSFKCSIVRKAVQDAEGKIVFVNTIQKVADGVKVANKAIPETAIPSSVVFLAKCVHCGCQVKVNSLAETHMRVLCNDCAVKAFPDAYHIKEAQV